jgi:hypothetical protein
MRAISAASASARRQAAQQFVDAGAVLADQRALGAALLGAAEHIERAAAQALQLRQQPKALRIQGPKGCLTSSPLALRLASSGGARWCTSL